MTDTWLFLHLCDSNHVPGPENPSLTAWSAQLERIRSLRAGSPDVRWFFDRLDNGVAVWVHADARTRRDIVRQFPAAAGPRRWQLGRGTAEPPTRQFADPSGRRRAEELAMGSSELALDLYQAGEPTEHSELPTAVLHLWSLLGAVTDSARTSFLFSCWEHWTRRMQPGQRVALAERAIQESDTELARSQSLRDDERLREVWHRQLRLVARIAADRLPADAMPLNYLLFEHVKTSSARLGLSRETLAVAASVLRRALLNGTISVQLANSSPEPAHCAVPAPS